MASGEQRPGGTPSARIYLLILLSTAFWGGTPVAGKLAIRDIPPMTVGVLRYGLASLVLILLFRRHLPAWRTLRRSDLWTLLGVGVLGTFLNHMLFFLLGDLFYILGGMAWGLYSFLSKVAMHRLSALATLAYGMAIGCVFLIPVAAMERPWVALASASPLAWASVLYLIVAGTLLAFFWWNLAIQRVGAGRTAVFTNLVPVFGVLLAWWVLGERLTPLQLFGGLLTVAGVWVCQGPGAMQAAWRQARVRLGGEQAAAPEKR